MRAAWVVLLLAAACEDHDDGGAALRRARVELERAQEELRVERDHRAQEQAQREAEQRSGLKVTLPGGTAADIDPAAKSVVVVIAADGATVVGGRQLSADELQRVFEAAFALDPQTQVVLQADAGAVHGRVVAIMEMAKAAGLTRLAIGTK